MLSLDEIQIMLIQFTVLCKAPMEVWHMPLLDRQISYR